MKIEIHDVAPRRALTIDGTEEPGGQEFEAAVGALYSAAYPLRFALKGRGVDEKVGHLEALWDRKWAWKLLIPISAEATDEEIRAAVDKAKGKSLMAERIRVETIEEGTVVEATHVGPYATEADTMAEMDAYAADLGYVQSGPHHEIYLSDPGRTAPEKLRTILRHPVRAASL